MAWTRLVSGSTAGNVSLDIDYNLASVTRTSNTNVQVKFGIRFSMSSTTYTYNNIAAFIPKDGTRYYAFGDSGSSHTVKGTYYYATSTSVGKYTTETSPFTIDIPVTITQTTASFAVGYGWNAYTPAQKGSSTITVSFPTGATAPTGCYCSVSRISENKATLSGGYGSNGGATVTSSGYQYSTNGSSWSSFSNGSTTLSPNTTYYFRYYATNSQGTSYSGNAQSMTYDWPKPTSMNNFTIGDGASVNLYNPLGRNVTLQILQNGTDTLLGSYTGTYNGVVNSEFKTTDAINRQYASIPESKNSTYYCKVTYSGNTKTLNDTSHNTYSIAQSDAERPTFSASNITDVKNTVNTAIAGSNYFIKGHNSLSFKVSPMTPQKSAHAGYYSASSSGLATVSKDHVAGTTLSFDLGNLTTNKFSVVAVDKRGMSRPVNVSVNLVEYIAPQVSPGSKITREDGIGTKAVLSFVGSYTNWTGLLQSNTISQIRYRTRLLPSGAYGSWKSLPSGTTITSSGGSWSFDTILTDTFPNTSSYGLQLEITDKLETVISSEYVISTADALLWRDLQNKRIGIRKKPDRTFDVGGDIGATGDIYSRGECRLQSCYSLDLSSLSTSNFYPVTFVEEMRILDCEIHSPSLSGSAAWNQNLIHFRAQSRGRSDNPLSFNILEYGVYSSSEITIGCIGYGTGASYKICVWLRGGMTYQVWSTVEPVLHTTNYDDNSSDSGSIYTVGTNYYGGSNTNVSTLFTPQSTIKKGAYFRDMNISASQILDLVYPVGSIYMSKKNTNPGTFIGGTWTRLKGRFIYGYAGSVADISSSQSSYTGGTVTGTTLTSSQSGMPSHGHGVSSSYSGADFYIRHGATSGTESVAAGSYTSISKASGATWGNGFATATYSHAIDRVNIGGTVSTSISAKSANASASHAHDVPWQDAYIWYRSA